MRESYGKSGCSKQRVKVLMMMGGRLALFCCYLEAERVEMWKDVEIESGGEREWGGVSERS